MKKSQRHAAILELIQRKTVRTQEELLEELKAMGFDTTQATVSRDIRDLKIVKTSDKGGYQYSSAPANRSDSDFANKLKTIFIRIRIICIFWSHSILRRFEFNIICPIYII